MNRNSSTNLYPMMVTPLDFKKGDVVKKIYADNIMTPYVGVVTAIIPSTNKVEVQWPHSTGIEDPWDLNKVNPIFNPPVVKRDDSYSTFQNTPKIKEHVKSLQHHNVLEDFIKEHMAPVIVMAATLYNSDVSKAEAFKKMSKECDNREIIKIALEKVYNDKLNVVRATDYFEDGEIKNAEVKLEGNSDLGFKLSYCFDNALVITEEHYPTIKGAVENFKRLEGILQSLSSSVDSSSVVENLRK